MAELTDLRFRGTDSIECEDFISAVNQWAFEKEKFQDDFLVAQFAYSRMAGAALRFYETLDEDVQGSWKRLRRALLAQHPPPDPRVPSPPAARSASIKQPLTGLICVKVEGESNSRYLGHNTKSHGRFDALEDRQKALLVQLQSPDSDQPQGILLLGSSVRNWLGLAWWSAAVQNAPSGEAFARFSCMDESMSEPSCKKRDGPEARTVWNFYRPSGKIEANWDVGGLSSPTEFGMDPSDSELRMFANIKEHSRPWKRAVVSASHLSEEQRLNSIRQYLSFVPT